MCEKDIYKEMDDVANHIVEMTFNGATYDELYDIVIHSINVIDSVKQRRAGMKGDTSE